MSNLIDSNSSNNGLQSPLNNPLLTQQSSSYQKTSSLSPSNNTTNNENEKQSSDLTVSLNSSYDSLGLYNSKGLVPVQAANRTDQEISTKNVLDPKGSFVSNGGAVVVDIMNSDSGYNNKIYWSTDNFKTRNYIGVDNYTGSLNIGTFAAGTKIDFGIDNQVGGFYRTGDASTNSDSFQHAQATATASGTQIGFEDLTGGGDKDFNDAIINVRNLPIPGQSAPKDNRSGLGDGTNPGQGSGTANSPNQGTNNPNNVTNTSPVSAAAAKKTAQETAKKAAAEAATQKAAEVAAKKAAEAAAKKIAQEAAKRAAAETAAQKAAEAAAKKATEAAAKKIAQEAAKRAAAEAAAQKAAEAAAKKMAQAVAHKPEIKTPSTAEKKALVNPTNPTSGVSVQGQTSIGANNTNDNRSGLGDGTNPGQGNGKINSPNTGTNNPTASTAEAKLLMAILKS